MSQDFKYNYFYSYKGLYPIEWGEIPNRIRLSNGNTRTDKETFTEDELKDAGYVFTDIYPNYNDETHFCDWNSDTGWLISEYHYVDEQDSDG
jgi:hypothetical protein